MYRIAIVDDEDDQLDRFAEYVKRFSEENNVQIETVFFNNSVNFVSEFKAEFDIIFLDIKMPDINGMEIAEKLRTMDSAVPIIFVTSMAQFAVKGYEVDALDFVVKPINYFLFCQKLKRAVAFVETHNKANLITFNHNDNILRVRRADIYYIEKEGNYIVVHTDKEDFKYRGTMEDLVSQIGKSFARNLRGCLVNLVHVKKIDKNNVYVNKYVLPISRGYRQRFIEDFVAYKAGE